MPRLPLPFVLALAAAVALAAPPAGVDEVEPDSFLEPQPVGVLEAAGITVSGSLDPTSPGGGDPGDRDGYSFTPSADGPLTAVVDDGGAGRTFVLGLAEPGPSGPILRAAVIGPAPLTLVRPDLEAGTDWTVGVAALGDGNPLPYTLDLRAEGELPAWTGEICPAVVDEVEPNPSPDRATDLGPMVGTLCGRGSLSSVAPEGAEFPGEYDLFRFRPVLPVPLRLTLRGDPGEYRVEIQQLVFVGAVPVASAVFGQEGTLEIPYVEPGADYFVQVRATYGTAPLAYDFHLEAIAALPGEEPEPLEIRRAVLRFDPAGRKARFDVRALFEPGLGSGLGFGTPLAYTLREIGEEFAAGTVQEDARGRLVYRAPPGSSGLKRMVFDPFRGTLRMKGKGLDPGGSPSDPTVALEVTLGDLVLRAEEQGAFAGNGKRLKVKR